MTVRICARPRGPLVVENPDSVEIELFRADGSRVELPNLKKLRVCRCGASAYAPLCDGSHDRIGFEAPAPSDDDSFRSA